MGNHRVASAVPRAGNADQHAAEPETARFISPGALNLRNWPVSTRLIAVIVLALLMGLVFGGLRVASAADSAAEFGQVSQLAALGQQVTGLVQALENERDETAGQLPVTNPKELQHWYSATDAAAARVRTLAAGIGGSFPANIQTRVSAMLSVINNHTQLERTAQASQSVLSVIENYAAPINNMIALDDQIAQGTSDATLVSDVQTLNSLSLAKDQAAQQRALLFNALTQQIFADGVQQALTTAESEELTDLTAFQTTATPAEQSTFTNTVGGPRVNQAQEIEIYVEGLPLGTIALDIGAGALGFNAHQAPAAWYAAQSGKVDDMQQVELGVAGNIVSRAQSLQSGAEELRADHRHRDRAHPAPGAARDRRRGPVPGRAAAQAAGRRAQHRHGRTAGAGPAAGRGPGSLRSAWRWRRSTCCPPTRSARLPARSTRSTPRRYGWPAMRPCCATTSTRCSSTSPAAASR